MQDEDKIYGLMAQAEDIQTHAVKLQQIAQSAVKTLPEGFRAIVKDEAKQIITDATKNASEGLLRVSREVQGATTSMRRTWLLHGIFLLAVATVISGCFLGFGYWFVQNKASELAVIENRLEEAKKSLKILENKTWGLELVDYGDGTRGIILPKGADIKHTGQVRDGRMGIVIIP